MRTLTLQPLVAEGFSLTPKLENDRLVVHFSGNGDMAAVEALGRYLARVHLEALELSVVDVSFNFADLYFMNSSCFKAFVTLITRVDENEPPAYGIRFLTNANLHWQRRSLEALRYLAPRVVSVEPLPP